MVAFLTIATALITVLTVLTYFHVRPPKAYCRRRFPCFFEDKEVEREGEAMTPDESDDGSDDDHKFEEGLEVEGLA